MAKCVEIEKNEDGTFTVSECEPKGEMMAEEEGAEPQGQKVGRLKEALQLVAQLISTDDAQAATQADEQAGFDQATAQTPMQGKAEGMR